MGLEYIGCQVFSRRYFPKGDFPSEIFQNVQFPKRQLPKGQVRSSKAPQLMGQELRLQDSLGQSAAAIGQSRGRALRLQDSLGTERCGYNSGRCGQKRLEKLLLGKITLGHLGKYFWEVATQENTLGKLPLGKMPLGKYLTSYIDSIMGRLVQMPVLVIDVLSNAHRSTE